MAPIDPQKTIVAIGECMLELSRPSSATSAWQLHSGGDTFNTAVYLARLGFDIRYLTALGKDRFSDIMRAEWQAEGVAIDMVLTHPDRVPGLYAISVDELGERSFTYWRQESAARALFECPGVDLALRNAERARLLFLSGITLAVLEPVAQEKLIALAKQVRANGGLVAFDCNYRPRLWNGAAAARRVFDRIAPAIDIVLPSIEDQREVYGDTDTEAAIRRWSSMGVKEIVVKQGAQGATVWFEGKSEQVIGRAISDVRDTTGAGDAFNGGYLAARLAGKDPLEAAAAGNLLAGAVVRHAGAVIPKVTMPLGLPKAG